MVLDLAVLEQDAPLEADTIAHDDIGTDDHIRSNAAVLADLGGRVNHDITAKDVGLSARAKELGVALRQRAQVEASAAEEVLGLSDIHPETLQVERVELAVLADGGESLLLDRGGTEINALQDAGVENVDTGVDAVSYELDGFLDEAVDARGMVRLVDDDTVLGGLLHFGHHDRTFITVTLVEGCQLLEWVFTDDIGVQNEEWRVVLAQDLLGQLQGTGRSQGFRLHGELDVDVVLFLILKTAARSQSIEPVSKIPRPHTFLSVETITSGR